MIVVTFALPTESSAFIRFLKNVRRDGAVVRGNVEHRTSDICVVHTGVGAAKCEERLGNFLRAETPELLIASGFCGGTTDELHPGAFSRLNAFRERVAVARKALADTLDTILRADLL